MLCLLFFTNGPYDWNIWNTTLIIASELYPFLFLNGLCKGSFRIFRTFGNFQTLWNFDILTCESNQKILKSWKWLVLELNLCNLRLEWFESNMRPWSFKVHVGSSYSSFKSLELKPRGSCVSPVLHPAYASTIQGVIAPAIDIQSYANCHVLKKRDMKKIPPFHN